jgi:hypothetical protein
MDSGDCSVHKLARAIHKIVISSWKDVLSDVLEDLILYLAGWTLELFYFIFLLNCGD